MATLTPEAMTRLHEDISYRRIHLNTGEYLTMLIITALAWAQEDRSVDRAAVYDASPLSKSTVDSHFRTLQQRGLITRTPHDVFTHL